MVNRQSFREGYYAGLSGLQLPVPKYQFPTPYQNASRLTYYSTFFNSIEVNSSFYKLPQAATIRKWADSVLDGFKFTFKVWKQITHNKGLLFDKSDVSLFLKAIETAAEKKGCLLLQFPPSLDVTYFSQLHSLLQTFKEANSTYQWDMAVEFRHKSWYDDRVYELVDYYNLTIVIQDIPKSATPIIDLLSNVIYLRFHGPTGNYRGAYENEILSEYSGYISDWLEEKKKVYVYFNNTMGEAFQNLQTLNGLLKQE